MTAKINCSGKSRRGVLTVRVLGFILLAGIAAAQNLATNPGFENGDTSGWSAFGSPTISVQSSVVHAGSYAGLVANRTATYMGISQPFLGVLQSNQTYAVSAWVQLVGGTGQTVQIEAQRVDGAGTSYATIASGTVAAGAWTQLAGQYTLTLSNTLTSLIFYLQVTTSSNAAYYVDDLSVQSVNLSPTNGSCTVDGTNLFQRIDGFGASSAWQSTWTTAQGDMFFSTNSGTGLSKNGTNFPFAGIGLSLLRTRIAPGGTTVENSLMVMAQARGAKVWSTPWSPQASFKSNGNVNGGGFVGNTANYQAYANQLAGYVVNMKSTYGINLYALSVQNEPDANVTTYESCNWNAQQFHDFIPYLYNALAASNVTATKIIFPESQNWLDYSNLAVTATSDTTSNYVAIIADHNYDGATGPSSLVKNSYGKALWETEVSLLTGSDSSITNGVYYAGRIHSFLTSAQVNAWHYWWLMPGNSTGNQGLTDTNGVPAKRMYALGQFSRFVRPNFYRVNVAGNTGSAQVSAYKDSLSQNFAIVAINSNSVVVTQTFNLTNFGTVAAVTPWITSGTMSLSNQPVVAVSGSAFAYALPAMSIVTFAGLAQASNTPPTLASVANQTINAGVTLVVTNVATDTNVPAQTLTFSLLNAPANAALNSSNGIFIWRPPASAANTTNLVSVKVVDSGTPSLSATNSFNITVNPLAPPVLSSIAAAAGQVSLTVNGPVGPDYTLMTSTNLTNWQPLFTTNSPAPPFMLVDTNLSYAARFYRIQIGP